MNINNDNAIVKMADKCGRILAFITVMLWFLTLLNAALNPMLGYYFLGQATGVIMYIKYWATLLTVALSGLEFAFRRTITAVIYIIAVVACVILMFFPGTFYTLAGIVVGK
ncbi:MAG: hypothetical protein IKM44_02475 [Clostridia bacterium]|nr:hypothetical protein [Clostridia bacterium]